MVCILNRRISSCLISRRRISSWLSNHWRRVGNLWLRVLVLRIGFWWRRTLSVRRRCNFIMEFFNPLFDFLLYNYLLLNLFLFDNSFMAAANAQ